VLPCGIAYHLHNQEIERPLWHLRLSPQPCNLPTQTEHKYHPGTKFWQTNIDRKLSDCRFLTAYIGIESMDDTLECLDRLRECFGCLPIVKCSELADIALAIPHFVLEILRVSASIWRCTRTFSSLINAACFLVNSLDIKQCNEKKGMTNCNFDGGIYVFKPRAFSSCTSSGSRVRL
jgi:hypothetical protein